MENGRNYIPLFVFSLILTNAASVHSTNTRRQLVAALEPNTVLVEHHDQGHLAPAMPFLEPFTATTALATETNKLEAVYLPSSPFPPEASCMMAIWSLIVDIPTPGPALSAALHQAKDTLAPSAVASPQCTITLPATLSSEYGVYTSRVSSWVSKHSEELDTLDSVCAETSRDMGTGPGCTAPVAVFTGASSTGATSTGTTSTGTSTAAGGGSGGGNSTAKATGSSAGVMTPTKTGTGMTTTTTTVATVTSSVTSSLTGSATTFTGVTSSQSASGPQQAGSAVRVTGVVAAAMVVAGILAVVVAL